ncbi:MAG: DUF6531 domain-containing protein [Polyangiaceae bacterium]|nr:DUF6531 domain-containing protein [Polyangiaceae bacterium]
MQKVITKTCVAGLGDRFVGDPIDVVTGAFVDDVRDFVLAGDVPLEFRRTYSTEWVAKDCGLGRGYSHSFNHCLERNLDGISYISPRGIEIDFPTTYAETNRVVKHGYALVNEGHRLVVEPPDGTKLIFENTRPTRLPWPLRLLQVHAGGGSVHVHYNPNDPLARLTSLVDSYRREVFFRWEDKHIVSAHIVSRTSNATSTTNLVRYFYDGDLLVEVEDAYKHRLKYEYDADGRLTKRTDRRGYSFTFQYDRDGRCTHSAAEDGMLEVSLQHFPLERRTKVARSDGGVWEYHYNAAKTLMVIVDPEGVERSFVPREEDGQIDFEIDGAGNQITNEYDSDGRLVAKRDRDGRQMAEEREHPVPLSPQEYELGGLVQLTKTFPEPTFLQTHVPPDVAELLTVAQLQKDGSVHQVRDVQGLLIREERDGLTRRYAYDPDGNLHWEIDFDGGKTEYEYASYNHLTKITDPNGFQTRLEYTKQDTLHAVMDTSGTRTEYPRDLRGEIKGIERFDAKKEEYKRDGAGRLIEKTDAQGRKLYEIRRGPQGEVLERTFASGGFERFTYEDDVRVVAAETPSAKCTFAYDDHGNRIKDMRNGKGVKREFEDGKLMEHRVLEKFITRYEYTETPFAKEATITDPTGRTHRLRDHGYGVVTKEWASGRKETTQYHPDGHVLVRHVGGEKSATWARRFQYSGEGYLVARFDSQTGPAHFEHDAGHRLVAVQGPAGSRQVFEHDAAGNLTRNGNVGSARYDGSLLMEANGRQFEHDIRQAVRSEQWHNGVRRFYRDERDQLVWVESYQKREDGQWHPNPHWTAKYDALNRRIEKNFYGETTTFYWDTDRLAAEVMPDGQLRVYVYADALAMTPILFVNYAGVEADPSSGTVYAVFADHLGCPERIEDMEGTIVWAARIAPYGMVHVTEGKGFHQPLRWPGHYYDRELKLHYNRFRTYSPELGRYYEPDPLGRGGGLENVYAYTNNPLFRVDTHGLACPFAKGAKGEGKNDGECKPDTETHCESGHRK